MSSSNETDTQNPSSQTSILLPASQIAVFAKDEETLKTANALTHDWRFARVEIAAHNGDVNTAIETFQNTQSPELIIIQTETIDDGFTAQLGALAEHCSEGTSAIIIGPDNDVNLYRQLIDMGVSDYLVRPVQQEVLSEVIARALVEKIGVTGSRLVAVLGAKGGVGGSIISEALACGTAEILKQKTLLLDMAGGWSTLSVGLGFEPSTTLAEAAKAAEAHDEENLARMLHRVSDNLKVLATGGDAMLDQTITAEQLEALVDMVMARNPVVVADLSHSAEVLQRAVISRASQIVIVATPTLPALRLARSLLHEVKTVRGDNDKHIKLLINMQGMGGKAELNRADIEAAMEFKVSAFVPFEPAAFLENETKSKKLTDDKDARQIIEQTLLPLLEFAGPAPKAVAEKAGLLGGLLGKLKG